MKINLYYYDGTVKTRNAFVKEYEEYDEVTILPEEIGRNVQYAEIDPEFFVAEVGDEGYMLSSTTIALNTALLYFNEKEDFTEKIIGKRGSENYSKMLNDFRTTFLNIDMEVIRELEVLFFQLW
jgi:hypothetical protein